MKTSGPSPRPPEKRHHVYAVPEKAAFEIRFPRVERYTQAIRNRVTVDWTHVASIVIDPSYIPPEVEMKATVPNNVGRMSLSGPGRLDGATLNEFRAKRRLQELTFELARTLTRDYVSQPQCEVPTHVLFPQLLSIVQRYVNDKVEVRSPASIKDVFLAPYYGWVAVRAGEEGDRCRSRARVSDSAVALCGICNVAVRPSRKPKNSFVCFTKRCGASSDLLRLVVLGCQRAVLFGSDHAHVSTNGVVNGHI